MNDLSDLRNALECRLPFHKKKLEKMFHEIDHELQEFLRGYILLYDRMGVSVGDIAEAYAMLLRETMKEQIFFSKNQHYRYSTYEEVRSQVYDNPDFMKKYMMGLGLSTVLWPSHIAIYKFFRNFINDSDYQNGGGYLEVGAGHGLFSWSVLRKNGWDFYDIVDISETSIKLSRDALYQFVATRNLRFIHADFLAIENDATYATIVIGEVLEHVENPVRFIKKARCLLSSQGRVYISTCLNAPEPDHIYLFTHVNEVEKLFTDSDFVIEQKAYFPYEEHTVGECEEEKLPINVAYILKPR